MKRGENESSNNNFILAQMYIKKKVNVYQLPDKRKISSSASISQASLTLSWKSSKEVEPEEDANLLSFLGLAL